MVDITISNSSNSSTYKYIIEKLNREGALHFSLIDPEIKQLKWLN